MGFVGAFELDGDLVGTIRIVPMGHDLTLTENLMLQLGASAPPIAPGDWEVGRLVLSADYRSDVNSLRHCLSLSLAYALQQARIGHLYAPCTHVLSRLYRRFAFSAFAKDVSLPGGDKLYTLIRGSATEVSMALSGAQSVAQPQ